MKVFLKSTEIEARSYENWGDVKRAQTLISRNGRHCFNYRDAQHGPSLWIQTPQPRAQERTLEDLITAYQPVFNQGRA